MTGCTSPDQTELIAREYFETYAQRTDFNKFINFYDQEVELRDIVNGDEIKGRQNLASFFNWAHPDLKMIHDRALVLEDLIIAENKAIGKGHFTEFKWGESTFGPMHFTMILIFNEQGKITRQTDWINYPITLIDYTKRKDSNEWISEKN